MSASIPSEHAVQVLHYAAPIVVFIYYLAATAWTICNLQTEGKPSRSKLRKALVPAMFLVFIAFASEAGIVIAQIFTNRGPFATTHGNMYALSSTLLWIFLFAVFLGSEQHQWYPYYGAWALSLLADLAISIVMASNHPPSNPLEWAQLSVQAFRIFVISFLLILYFSVGPSTSSQDEETAPLLTASKDPENSSVGDLGYGSTATVEPDENDISAGTEAELAKREEEREEKLALLRARLRENGNWWTYMKGFKVFVPHIWPTKKPLLQLNMVGVALCLLASRVLNILAPRQLGIITNALSEGTAKEAFTALGIYAILEWMKSSSGVEGLRQWLWLPVQVNAHQALGTASYNHIMGLSCDFHDQKNSGELYAAMNQGSSIIELLEEILWYMGPQILDLFVACFYFYFLFDAYLVLIVVAVMIAYFWLSVYTTIWQTHLRRKNNVADRQRAQVLYDTMGSWRTVTYFNRIPHACQTYAKAVRLSQRIWQQSSSNDLILWAVRQTLLDIGTLGALTYGIYQIFYGGKSVGTFVTLLTYWGSVTGGIPYLAYIQRNLIHGLVDAEELLRLFQTKPSVQDGPNELSIAGGNVAFEKVSFSYDGKKNNIKDISFHAKQGQKVALIGETGAGKSTILKLLFRFYDVTNGSVSIDGQDTRNVTLESLRDCIGVVPQDPSLFNDTVIANVRYAKLDATDEQVMDACKAAAIHDKILTFTDGYQTKVGEHGVKVSGGELQRIAIARAILKNPKIILLDEATSSVDSETEGKIQEGLQKLCQGRTTFVVAHRLSTIMDSDFIIVIKDGTILEEGTPSDLFRRKGKYYRLWTKQMGITDATTSDEDASSSGVTLQDTELSGQTSRSKSPSTKDPESGDGSEELLLGDATVTTPSHKDKSRAGSVD